MPAPSEHTEAIASTGEVTVADSTTRVRQAILFAATISELELCD